MTRNRIADEISSAPEQSSTPESPTYSSALESDPQVERRLARVTSVQTAFNRMLQFGGWPWLIVLLLSWLMGVSAFQRLSNPPAAANCDGLAVTLSESEQLSCAEKAARKQDEDSLAAALKLASSFGKEHPLYARATQLADQWSASILRLARRKLDQGDLIGAIALANEVPKSSQVHEEAQGAVKRWQDNRKYGEKLFKQAQEDIKEQYWTAAMVKVRDLSKLGDDYWQQRADKVLAELKIEKQSFLTLDRARILASSNNPDDIVKAIQLTSKINPERLAWEKGQEEIGEWSLQLLDIARDYQADGSYELAKATAQKIPPGVNAAQRATALIQRSQAESVAQAGNIWSYVQAWMVGSQVEPEVGPSPRGDLVNQWGKEVQNRGQLQLAKWFANLDHVGAYQLAIAHAAMIEPDAPQRLEAQTFIAQWQKQIDNFDDHQHLALARQFAAQAQPKALKAAIVEATKVQRGQPLRTEAQTLIAEWEGNIERIEDQPILDKARTLAKQGKLEAAIQTAEQIKADRSLYGEAQADIDQWVAEIQIAVDGPILSDAKYLANEGRYYEAISRASQIGYGRALYYEAQDWIAQWRAEIAAIEAARQPQQTERYESYPDEDRYVEPESQYEPEPEF